MRRKISGQIGSACAIRKLAILSARLPTWRKKNPDAYRELDRALEPKLRSAPSRSVYRDDGRLFHTWMRSREQGPRAGGPGRRVRRGGMGQRRTRAPAAPWRRICGSGTRPPVASDGPLAVLHCRVRGGHPAALPGAVRAPVWHGTDAPRTSRARASSAYAAACGRFGRVAGARCFTGRGDVSG